MRDEKRFLGIVILVIAAIVIVSLNPEYTGSAIGTEDDSAIVFDSVLPGSTAAQSLDVRYDDLGPVLLEIGTTGEAASWIVLSSDTYQLYPGVENRIPLSVVVPLGVSEGTYSATLVLMRVQNSDATSILNDQVLDYLDVEIVVTEDAMEQYSLSEFTVFDVEEGRDIPFAVTVDNVGNTRLDKEVQLTVTDASGTVVAEEVVQATAYALEAKEIIGAFGPLPTGRYTATATIDNDVQETVFDVHEEDSLMRRAELVYSDVGIDRSGVVDIVAVVKNTGDIPLTVSLAGSVTHDDGIRSVRSGSTVILPGREVILADSYKEDDSGEFALHLEVLSGNAALLQKDTVFYSSNAIDLEANFAIIFGMVIVLLIVTHYVLSRRRQDE